MFCFDLQEYGCYKVVVVREFVQNTLNDQETSFWFLEFSEDALSNLETSLNVVNDLEQLAVGNFGL